VNGERDRMAAESKRQVILASRCRWGLVTGVLGRRIESRTGRSDGRGLKEGGKSEQDCLLGLSVLGEGMGWWWALWLGGCEVCLCSDRRRSGGIAMA
jgi:hypothetical protein